MSEKRRQEGEARRSYRSTRRREQEEAAQSRAAGPAPTRAESPAAQPALARPRPQPAARPQPVEAPAEKVAFYAAGPHVLRRSTSTIQRKKQKKHRGWTRPLRWSLAPVALILVGLVIAHFALLGKAPAVGAALAEEEVYERNNFPLYYRALIEEAADHYNVPASLMAAMVLAESSYDAGVENSIHARGLMQLMPDTAGWVSEKLDEEATYDFDKMFNAEDNLRYGGWYLQYLLNRFDGNMVNAVCGYHAGQGNVDAWLANPEYSHDGKTLYKIPTADTGKYATRVLNAQQVYQRRYFQTREGAPTAIKLPKIP